MAQRLTNTAPNRYPDIFRTLRARVEAVRGKELGAGNLRILSFGCSAGFEMLSLRAYFPDASIFGCDTSAEALYRARRNLREDAGITFYSTPDAIDAFGPFDIIMAMSVLCQYPASAKAQRLDRLFPFQTFQTLTENLNVNLKPGGLLCVFNSNYPFSSLKCSTDYRAVRSELIHSNGFVDKFASDGRRATESFRNKALFSHRAVDATISDDDLRDCIFEKSGMASPINVTFLQTRPPADVIFDEPVVARGIAAETALADGVIAAHRAAAFGTSPDGTNWMRAEWRKTTLDDKVVGFGPWYVMVGPERAKQFSNRQTGALAETISRTRRSAVLLDRAKPYLSLFSKSR